MKEKKTFLGIFFFFHNSFAYILTKLLFVIKPVRLFRALFDTEEILCPEDNDKKLIKYPRFLFQMSSIQLLTALHSEGVRSDENSLLGQTLARFPWALSQLGLNLINKDFNKH